jgi:hypothetical protein
MYPRIRTEGPRPVRDHEPNLPSLCFTTLTIRNHANPRKALFSHSVPRKLPSLYLSCMQLAPCTCNSILTESCYFFSEGRSRIRAGSGRFPHRTHTQHHEDPRPNPSEFLPIRHRLLSLPSHALP